MNETEAKFVLNDVIDRFRRNTYEALYDAAFSNERINGEVPGPHTGTLYPIVIATGWVDEPDGNIRVTVVVHDNGADQFDPLEANFEKGPDNSLV